MRPQIAILVFLLSLASCKSARRNKTSSQDVQTKTVVAKPTHSSNSALALPAYIVDYAKSFQGVRYRYGGVDRKGMDCSGLVYVSFRKADIKLPRISKDMAKEGQRISLSEVMEGDLLFFQTKKNRKGINHVGLVVTSPGEPIQFIHSTTSKGVIISGLSEPYWKTAFIEARRML